MSNIVPQSEFNNEQLELIKATVAKGATTDELKLFLYRCKNMGLDPLKPGQVHFVKYNNSPGTMIVGLDGIRGKAAKTGKISGIKRGVTKDSEGRLIGGWCEVYIKGWDYPVREDVSLSEYDTGKAQWATKKETMIKKVAEVAALRMACPDELGGLYSEEEMARTVTEVNKTKELTAQVQATNEVPEFEASQYFQGEALAPEVETSPAAPGDFIFSVGKELKGKKLRMIPTKKIEGFIQWADEQPEPIHADILECKLACIEYLLSIQPAVEA